MISRRRFFEKTGLAALGGLGATALGNLFPELQPASANVGGPLQPYDSSRAAETGVAPATNVTMPVGLVEPAPLIAVSDLTSSSEWYRTLLDLDTVGTPDSDHEELGTSDDVVIRLHRWGADAHTSIGDESDASRGNGAPLWFEVEHFDAAEERASSLGAETLEGPEVYGDHRELWIRDLDGYVVALVGQPGDLGEGVTNTTTPSQY